MFAWIVVLLLILLLPGPARAACPPLDIADFDGVPNAGDTTSALQAAVAAASTGCSKVIRFGTALNGALGIYHFTSPPPILTGGISLIGQSKSSTVLQRDYSDGDFLVVRQNGTRIQDLTLWAGPGTSGGVGLHVIADAQDAGGNHIIDNVWITGPGTWGIPLFLDGLNRTVAPQGLRTVALRDVSVFQATGWAVDWWNCVGCIWSGGGAFQGGGTTQLITVGGPLGTLGLIDAIIDSGSTIWPGALRAPIR
jgi:hypothetical protein